MEAPDQGSVDDGHEVASPPLSARDFSGGTEHTHTKPITPADIFDLENDRDSIAAGDPSSPTSAELMPPPPRSDLRPTSTHPPNEHSQTQSPPKTEHPHEDHSLHGTGHSGAAGELSRSTSPTVMNGDSPEDPLEPFDWDGLERRYHRIVADKNGEFEQVWEEYCQLQDFFSIWCEMVGKRETDRTYKRHKTQQFYVRNEEAEYELDRKHYVGIVDAFKSAMALLGR